MDHIIYDVPLRLSKEQAQSLLFLFTQLNKASVSQISYMTGDADHDLPIALNALQAIGLVLEASSSDLQLNFHDFSLRLSAPHLAALYVLFSYINNKRFFNDLILKISSDTLRTNNAKKAAEVLLNALEDVLEPQFY